MKSILVLILSMLSVTAFARSDYSDTVNDCIRAWKDSPFKKGAEPDKIITGGVKVLGIGKGSTNDEESTSVPKLVLVRPAVNVLGKSTIRLMNPNGWYCLKANVTVLGKIAIEAHCKAHLASASDDGVSVMAGDDSSKGVAVLGTLRIKQVGCSAKENAKEQDSKVDKN